MKSTQMDSQLEFFGGSLAVVRNYYNIELSIDKGDGIRVPLAENTYLCPMCLSKAFFVEDDIYNITADFTKDHFPPESVAGKKWVYVCSNCNNTAGADYDYSLKEYLQYLSFIKKKENAKYPLRVMFEGRPGFYKIMAHWEKETLVKTVDFKKYPHIKNWLLDFKKNTHLYIETRSPKAHLMQRAMLKAAFLQMFSTFGFDFALSRTGREIFDVLSKRTPHPMSNFGVFEIDETLAKNNIYRIIIPIELSAFMVCSTVEFERERKSYAVIIPFAYRESWDRLTSYNPYENKELPPMSIQVIDRNFVIEKEYLEYSKLSILPGKQQL